MIPISPALIRRGSELPPPERQQLQAGPLSIILEQGALRSIKLGQTELLHGIYAAVRDENWGTVEPTFLTYTVEQQQEAFEVHFTAQHIQREIDFVWEGSITGSDAGTLVFDFAGEARSTFRRARIGFCILHPMELAGQAVEIETTEGVQQSVFPAQIAPHQPFKELKAMRYSIPNTEQITVELRFSGDLFETEDQRNWTDASYKTYCTPLRLPFPVEVQAGERIQQQVTLRLLGDTSAVDPTPSQPETLTLKVLDEVAGTLPMLGVGSAPDRAKLSEQTLERLRALKLNHLWVELELQQASWQQAFTQAIQEAQALTLELELSVVCALHNEALRALFERIAGERLPVARILLFPDTSPVTSEEIVQWGRQVARELGITAPIGGGSRANFTEFNRADLPYTQLELAGYPINPQVHAFDDHSLVETLKTQGETVRNALRLTGALPLSIGPVTLKPRFNAVATGTIAETQASKLPENADARQLSLFAAGWTLGSIAALAYAGARWLTYYETVGIRGLLIEQPERLFPFSQLPPNAVFPLYHLFADLGDCAQGTLLKIERSDELALQALALRQEERLLVLLANSTAQTQKLSIHLPDGYTLSLRVLDERVAEQALATPESFRRERSQKQGTPAATLELELLPYAYVCVVGES